MSRREDRPAEDRELELLKAVAQAWHGHSGNPRPTREFDAARKGVRVPRPTRFKLEAVRREKEAAAGHWDFGQSLWDSYEIVTLSRKLESGLALADQNAMDGGAAPGPRKRIKRESKNSLRNLFRGPSRRLDNLDVHVHGDDKRDE